ncbi:MAG: T9SS type A sorting domain-containing protein [candidate division KSB1 bacterium]|nr:T9SS type A sorting domain-containing protein [candidate division KSB1 bacterium]
MKKVLNNTLFLLALYASTQAQDRSPYIWQTPVTFNVNAPESMLRELRAQIDTVLQYNALAPLRVYYGDIIWETYFMYLEPARVIWTLARAYNHLTPAQRTAVGDYIRAELAHPTASPWQHREWNTAHLSRIEGKRREYHPLSQVWGHDNYANLDNRPVMHILYGIWLYAFNSKDYAIISENWNMIREYYNNFAYRELNLLSGLGAAVAMARMANYMNDAATLQTVLNHLNTYLRFTGLLDSARNFAYNGLYGWDAPYPYDTDRGRDLVFMNFFFLNIPPEICRFLDDYYRSETLAAHQNELRKFPIWWIRSVPYWSRWTGDESVGLPTEVCGMTSPIERWIVRQNPDRFALYTRSVPNGIGDSHWLEMLIDAIEVRGQTQWVDVRTFSDNTPPAAITDLRVIYRNSQPFLVWTTPSDNGLNGRPFNYHIRYSANPITDANWNTYSVIPYNQTIKPAGVPDTLALPVLGLAPSYYIAVKSSDDFNNLSAMSNIIVFDNRVILVDHEQQPEKKFMLEAYPNPFNPQTTIRFQLPSPAKVNIAVYSALGELVDTLVKGKFYAAGEYSTEWTPKGISSGFYMISITAEDPVHQSKMTKTSKVVYVK